MVHETFNVVGSYNMEEIVFARCTNYEKAQKAMSILKSKGFVDSLDFDIVKASVIEDVLNIDGKLIEL